MEMEGGVRYPGASPLVSPTNLHVTATDVYVL